MADAATFVTSNDIGWEKAGEGVRRQVMKHGDDLMIVRVEFNAGSIGPMHAHAHRQASYVIAGRFEVTIGEETKELGAGDVFYVPANIPHGAKALEGAVLIDVFTPIREDFLAPVS